MEQMGGLLSAMVGGGGGGGLQPEGVFDLVKYVQGGQGQETNPLQTAQMENLQARTGDLMGTNPVSPRDQAYIDLQAAQAEKIRGETGGAGGSDNAARLQSMYLQKLMAEGSDPNKVFLKAIGTKGLFTEEQIRTMDEQRKSVIDRRSKASSDTRQNRIADEDRAIDRLNLEERFSRNASQPFDPNTTSAMLKLLSDAEFDASEGDTKEVRAAGEAVREKVIAYFRDGINQNSPVTSGDFVQRLQGIGATPSGAAPQSDPSQNWESFLDSMSDEDATKMLDVAVKNGIDWSTDEGRVKLMRGGQGQR